MVARKSDMVIDPDGGVIRRVFANGCVRTVGYLCKCGYVNLNMAGKVVLAHRIIWQHVNGPIPEGFEIDHRNGVRTDNRIGNLRLLTHAQNMQNRKGANRNSGTGVKGVSWSEKRQKWIAQIGAGGKVRALGGFPTIEEAAAAYQGAAAILHTHNPHAKKEGPAETDPNGLQHPGGETTTRNTGISV